MGKDMKMKIIGIIVGMLLTFTILSQMGIARVDNHSAPSLSSDESSQPYYSYYLKQRDDYDSTFIPLQYGDVIDQYMIEPTNFGWQTSLLQWVAQGFTPNMSILTRVEIELFKIGNPPPDTEIYIGVWDDLYGEELAYMIFSEQDFPGTRQWFTCDFEDIIVEPGHTYYIVCLSSWFDIEIGYYWFAVYNNPYPRGDAWASFLGIEWILLDDPPDHPLTDCCFKTYGIDKSAMKWTFLRGSISNQTTIANYTVLIAKDLYGFQIFPLTRVHYTDNEKISIYNTFLGIVNDERVFGIFRAHI